jgi:hypothetical protein
MGFRGSRGDTQGKSCGVAREALMDVPFIAEQRVDIRERSSIRSVRESELPIVPFGSQSSITLGEGRGNAFIGFLKKGRKEIAACSWKLQRKSGDFRGNYTRGPNRVAKAPGRR